MINFAFFGTPAFAVPSLTELHKFCQTYNYQISFVTCQPDKPQGRGLYNTSCAIKQAASNLGIKIFQPYSLKKATPIDIAKELTNHKVDLAIVVAYGKIIPKYMLNIPRLGFINIHASLLPKWRGAAPIQRSIEHGDQKTGISLMKLSEGMDEGPIFLSQEIPISSFDTTESLSIKLAHLGSETLINALPNIINNSLKPIEQNSKLASYANMIDKSEGLIKWDSTAVSILNKMRAMTPWPDNYTSLDGEILFLYNPSIVEVTDCVPGKVIATNDGLIVACKDLAIRFNEIKAAGKKKLNIKDFLNGRKITVGTVLGI